MCDNLDWPNIPATYEQPIKLEKNGGLPSPCSDLKVISIQGSSRFNQTSCFHLYHHIKEVKVTPEH